ncbi:PREDICTED: N-acetylserotonin O-methyltransferase-like protein [Condylura cristata]|uniref:N-acetylserotonin O-methyltransferase-like protein n=1 Tax=Condylura cristata TaxID=143302 RepID=UPI000642CC84|nr:PREDICTED: N-acetylserotonin O-methyltransferase-like protein [Condylura cristata]
MPTERLGVLQKDLRTPDVVIGADTIVTVDGLILEKPVDKQDAYRMLSRLSGKEHSVFTGVAIVHCSSRDGQLDTEVSTFFEETRVRFSALSEALLWEYIDSGEPMSSHCACAPTCRVSFCLSMHPSPLSVKCPSVYLPVLLCSSAPSCPCVLCPSMAPPVTTQLSHGGQRTVSQCPQSPPAGGWRLPGTGSAPPEVRPPPESRGVAGPAGSPNNWPALAVPEALFTACRLKVFDVLRDEAPLTAEAVARKIDASLGGTERLLDACVALGLLERTEQGYSNGAPASLHLVSDAERSLHSLVLHNDDHGWALFTHLASAVREGASQTRRAFGDHGEDPFQVGVPAERSVGFAEGVLGTALPTHLSHTHLR